MYNLFKRFKMNKFHPQISDQAVLKRVLLAVENGGEIVFNAPKAKKTFKIITDSDKLKEHPETFVFGNTSFCIIDMTPTLF